MRDSAGELSEGRQLLGLVELFLDLALHGDVPDDRDDAFELAQPPVQCRKRDGERRGPRPPFGRRRLELMHGLPRGEPPLGVGVLAGGQDVRDGPAEGLHRREPEDPLGRGVPAVDVIVGPDRDDRVTRRGDELLERPLGVGDLTVQAGVA